MISIRPYEFHITSHENAIKSLDIPIIGIDLISTSGFSLQRDWMTSYTAHLDSIDAAIMHLGFILKEIKGAPIFRVKIETPYSEDLDLSRFLYIESHFRSENLKYPRSINVITKEYMSTARTYDMNKFKEFADTYKDSKVELCVIDTNVYHDHKWFRHYGITMPGV